MMEGSTGFHDFTEGVDVQNLNLIKIMRCSLMAFPMFVF